ncbi:hypothetical protein [Escherichia coli]|nr:hypothetical protein [Escherichia coli]
MKKLRVTVEPFQGTIPFRILQRGRVLVEGSFSGKCTQLHSRTFQVNATNEEQGDSSARVCGDNQKRYTPGFTALTERGVVPS